MKDKPKIYKTLNKAVRALNKGEATFKTPKGWVNIKDWPHYKDPFTFNSIEYFGVMIVCGIIGAFVGSMFGDQMWDFIVGVLTAAICYPVMRKMKYG